MLSSNKQLQLGKVLIVDDTKTIVQILSMVLKKEGFEVFAAHSGEEALELLENISVDTILLDIQMGKDAMDGFETCKAIKKEPKTKDIPVIFLTAFDDLETRLKGFKVGGVDFISKSFDKTEILIRVKNQVNLFHLQNELKKGAAYIRAILNAQKYSIAILNSKLKLEDFNKTFADTINPDSSFSLIKKLISYDGYELPSSDEELFLRLQRGDEIKVHIKNKDGIYAIELTESKVLRETKKILTISDITTHERAKQQELELLKFKERYHNTQQQDAFKKQKKIIKDEVSHLLKDNWLFDSYYKPLDILSGDTLGTIKIGKNRYFFYIADAMGKGLSASVTSIQSTSFINNAVERAIEHNDYKPKKIVESFCHFIQKQILEEEILCVIFIDFNLEAGVMGIANYGMPPVLIERDSKVEHIKSNNPPIMSFFATANFDEIDLKDITKIALYSDGLNESSTREGLPYSKFIETDFEKSALMHQFLRRFEKKVEKLDDDVTLIYISNMAVRESLYSKKISIKPQMSELIRLSSDVEKALLDIGLDEKCSSEALLVFGELLMNAYEHGVLNLTPKEKQKLIEEDKYDEFLNDFKYEDGREKIEVEIGLSRAKTGRLMLEISIEDPGRGFEFSEALKTIHVENNDKYSGRGVWMAKDITDGIFFSETGNKTTFFKTVLHHHKG